MSGSVFAHKHRNAEPPKVKEETAQKVTPKEETPKKDDEKKPNYDFTFSGYIDASYNYLVSNNQFISNNYDRVYDTQEDGFTLQQVAITYAYQPERGIGGLVNLMAGHDALFTADYGYNAGIENHHSSFDVLQIYFQYTRKSFTLMAGKYLTLGGTESYDPTTDSNFSRSFLNGFATPSTTLGVRGIYSFNDKFKLILGVNNGWDSIRDTSRDKTIEAGVVFDPCEKLDLTLSGSWGEEPVVANTATGPYGARTLYDFTVTYHVTEKLDFLANGDYGTQTMPGLKAVWQGIAAYVNYKFNDRWRVSLRGEDFDDKDGYRTGVDQNLKELTFTVGYSPIKNLEFRAETRRDFSNVAAYIDRHSGVPRQTQQSYAIEMVYKFMTKGKSCQNS